MANRLGVVILMSIFGASCALTACGDDDSAGNPADGGGAGGETPSVAGSKTGGSASGGSSNTAGSGGGGGTAGVTSSGGAGGDAGAGGEVPTFGGAAGGAGGAGGGAGGEGGAAELVYACGSDSALHKVCSAIAAMNCTEAVSCPDCISEREFSRDDVGECPACQAEFDAFWQCAIDAFESGKLDDGLACFDGYPDINDDCGAHFNSALRCNTYSQGEPNGVPNGCPATWPLP